MAILCTIIVVVLFAAWVSRAYPAPTFLESLWNAGMAFAAWLTEVLRSFVDWILGAMHL